MNELIEFLTEVAQLIYPECKDYCEFIEDCNFECLSYGVIDDNIDDSEDNLDEESKYPIDNVTILDTDLARLFEVILEFQEHHSNIKFHGASKISNEYGISFSGCRKIKG